MPRLVQLEKEDQDKIRQILGTEKVDPKIPKWFLTAMNARFPRLTFPQTPGDAFNYAMNHVTNDSLLEHSGHITVGGADILVTEPYAEKINRESLSGLAEFAELVKLDYSFSANSWHYPGMTVRIVFESRQIK